MSKVSRRKRVGMIEVGPRTIKDVPKGDFPIWLEYDEDGQPVRLLVDLVPGASEKIDRRVPSDTHG